MIYQVPQATMDKIIRIINTLPYGQVAPLANELGQLIKTQTDQAQAKESRIVKPFGGKDAKG